MQETASELARAVSAADAQLRSTADQSVHLWALVCLLRAAEASGTHLSRRRPSASSTATAAATFHWDEEGVAPGLGAGAGEGAGAAGPLFAAWRSVWATLLRADQRFSNPTARCERNGVGEAVVAVLGACMRERLVEPGLVTKEQVSFNGSGGGIISAVACIWFLERIRVQWSAAMASGV